jgi:hypothetical protein
MSLFLSMAKELLHVPEELLVFKTKWLMILGEGWLGREMGG